MRGKERKGGEKGEGRGEGREGEKGREKVNHNLENKVVTVSIFKDVKENMNTRREQMVVQ